MLTLFEMNKDFITETKIDIDTISTPLDMRGVYLILRTINNLSILHNNREAFFEWLI